MDSLVEKAREIIHQTLYITIATSSKDGQPWNTPVYAGFDSGYNFYWVSDRNSQHSKNIKDNALIFLVIYDSTVPEGTGEGVYIKAKAYELSDAAEIDKAKTHLRKRTSNDEWLEKTFLDESSQRVYKAVPDKIWINSDKEINGTVIDARVEVHLPHE